MKCTQSQPCTVHVRSAGRWLEYPSHNNRPKKGTSQTLTNLVTILSAGCMTHFMTICSANFMTNFITIPFANFNQILHEPVKGMTRTWKNKTSALKPHAWPKYSHSKVLTTQMQSNFFFFRAWVPWMLSIRLCCILSLSALLSMIEVCLKPEQWWLIILPHEGSDAVQIACLFHGKCCTWHNETVLHDLRVFAPTCIRNVCILIDEFQAIISKTLKTYMLPGQEGFRNWIGRSPSLLCRVQSNVRLFCLGCLRRMQ